MTDTPPRQIATLKETLAFYAKLAAFIAGLAAFGFIVFLLRRAM